MDEKIRKLKRKAEWASDHNWLWRNIKLPQWRNWLTKHGTDEWEGVSTRWIDPNNKTQNLATVRTAINKGSKWADEGYTTIVHPGDNGVTVHRPGTLSSMVFCEPPVLRGHKPCGAKLWTTTLGRSKNERSEQINNIQLTINSRSHQAPTCSGRRPGKRNVDHSN